VSWWLLLLIVMNLALVAVVSVAWFQWRRERAQLATELRHYLDGTEKRLDAAVGQCQGELEAAGKEIIVRLRAEAAQHLARLQDNIARILTAARQPPQ
jgi:phosphoglycerate-specific signal transduction histidine kinase